MMSVDEYQELAEPGNLVDFLVRSPLADALRSGDLVIERSRDVGREIEF